MLKHVALLSFIVTVFGQTTALAQEVIRQREYPYDYDEIARNLDSDVFLVCSDCPDSKLNQIYTLSVRYSKPVATLSYSVTAVPPQDEPKTAPMVMSKPSLLGIVRFDFDSAVLTHKAKEQLDAIQFTNKNVALDGYACITGSEKYNSELSLKRAKAVSRYLAQKGISILHVKGLGESSAYKTKAENRRVEISDWGLGAK